MSRQDRNSSTIYLWKHLPDSMVGGNPEIGSPALEGTAELTENMIFISIFL